MTDSAVPRYTILLKNGQLLRHQDPLILAQYRSDVRLDRAWSEVLPLALQAF